MAFASGFVPYFAFGLQVGSGVKHFVVSNRWGPRDDADVTIRVGRWSGLVWLVHRSPLARHSCGSCVSVVGWDGSWVGCGGWIFHAAGTFEWTYACGKIALIVSGRLCRSDGNFYSCGGAGVVWANGVFHFSCEVSLQVWAMGRGTLFFGFASNIHFFRLAIAEEFASYVI